jgi:hypothetical protein
MNSLNESTKLLSVVVTMLMLIRTPRGTNTLHKLT